MEKKYYRRLSMEAYNKKIGFALRQRRIWYGIKQKEVAHRADITSNYLSEIESGKKTISCYLRYRLRAIIEEIGKEKKYV